MRWIVFVAVCALALSPACPLGSTAGCDTVDTFGLIDDGAADGTRFLDSAIGSDAFIGAAAIGHPAVDAVPESVGTSDRLQVPGRQRGSG